MENQDYHTVITVNAPANEAFQSIGNVSKWWTENVRGQSQNTGDVFTVDFGESFVTFQVVEAIPLKKIVWLCTECDLLWLTDKKEWKNTRVSFELTTENSGTQIQFRHIGLLPQVECYNDCVKGWNQYIQGSLYKLLMEGEGLPQKAKG